MKTQTNRVYTEVYGCPSNTADYELALGLLEHAGFEITKSLEDADLNIVFTCTVKVPTEKRMIQRIQQLAKLGKPLIIAGCMPKVQQRMIEKIAPKASMLGPDSIEKIVDIAKKTLDGEKIIFIEDLRKPKLCMPRVRKNKNVGIIPISTGCNLNCSYCCVKFARGKLFCYSVDGIVAEVKQAAKEGCKEIWLTSQDNGSYDFNGVKLPELLRKVCAVSGDFTIRVGMMNPTHIKQITDELIEAYKNEKIQKFLHLPVQSGSDKMLKMMKRGYTVEDFIEIVEKFRRAFPKLTLSTDIIVGFPSETEEDFQSTIELLKEIRPQKVNISKFGARPETEAAKMKQLPVETINERSRKLHEIAQKLNADL